MRPIDADKLPEHKFTRESAKGSDYMRGWNDAIDAIVDNAPPIETTIENLISTLSVEELKATTWFKVDTPSGEVISFRRGKTGEWIVGEYMDCHSDILPKYTCPFCGEVAYRKYDFCHCGADMRVKDELKEAENE